MAKTPPRPQLRVVGETLAPPPHLAAGDRVLAVETDKGILLTPYDAKVERALRIARRLAKKYRNALRELAN